MPGGELVVADAEVEDGALRHVRVAGDFFLDPDEALEAVNAALEGTPADTDAAAAVAAAARTETAPPAGPLAAHDLQSPLRPVLTRLGHAGRNPGDGATGHARRQKRPHEAHPLDVLVL